MLRIRRCSLPGIALALFGACAAPSTDPDPVAPPGDPGPGDVEPDTEQVATALGVAIDARDERGAPRLVRAVLPRAAAAGMTPERAARDHLAALAPLWRLPQQPAELVAGGVQRLRNGAQVVRLRQQVDHIDLHQGELRVMVHPDGSLVGVSGTMQPRAGRAAFRSTASAALDRALDALAGAKRPRLAIAEGAEAAGYRALAVEQNARLRIESARAKREFLPVGGQLVPIWSVEVIGDRAGYDEMPVAVARRYLISDGDGRVLRDVDLMRNDSFVYRAFAETTGTRRPADGALQSYNPHPTGTSDHSLPGPEAYNLVVMEAFNGPRDPWLAPTATTTAGNNVEAYADINLPSGFGPGDIRPEVRSGRTLNYRYDFAQSPLATPTQSKAAAVNAFFVTNWLHDWYYDSGFTEATGNAQLDNLGRGGIAGDPLVARAQAGALGGFRDNAQMATPEDGLSPIMNMFLWSGGMITGLTTPLGAPRTAIFASGPQQFVLTGTVALVQDVAGGTHNACGPVDGTVAGKIALFEWNGTCGSNAALDNIKAAGAIGVIGILTEPPGAEAGVLFGSPTANLPGLVIGDVDGRQLEAALPAEVTLRRETHIEVDGDLDNAVIAHEWGHYLHNRLASCEADQCSAISEGWGDFISLHMMLRETDNRDGTFATGLYALTGGGLSERNAYDDPGYFGIRRYPYSTDRSKNPLSFRHIADQNPLPETSVAPRNPGPARARNFEVHNAGEIWASMMWEAYNVLIDQHGYAEARRRISDYIVAGLLLTPPDASYTESRDALLTAASALDTEDMLLIAAAFAGRGAGTCAVSPPPGAFGFNGVVESGTLVARLSAGGVTLTDDGASCDSDGYLDPGESGTLRLTIANSGVIAAENVAVAVTTTTPGATLGKPLAIGDVAALGAIEVAIPVSLSRSAPANAVIDLSIRVTGDAGCNTSTLVVPFRDRIGVDELPAAATTDHVETRQVAWIPTGEFAAQLWSRVERPDGNHVLFGVNAPFVTDIQLMSPVLLASASEPLVVTAQHAYDIESFFDGGVVEVSHDAGGTWQDVAQVGADPHYPGGISSNFDNPLGGRAAFTGRNPAFPAREPLVLDFGTQFAGQPVMLRFRIGSDGCCTATGWELDDISVTGVANAPFPALVAEPAACTAARIAARQDSAVTATRASPRATLRGVPGATEAD